MRSSVGSRWALPGLLALLVSSFGCAHGASGPVLSNKWRLECDGGADSSGTIVLRVTPHQGPPTDVSVSVEAGTAENAVARSIRDALVAQLPVDRFHVETDDGEDVLVKKAAGQPDFAIEIVSSGVAGVRIHPDRE